MIQKSKKTTFEHSAKCGSPVTIWWHLWIISHISKVRCNKICVLQQDLCPAVRVVLQLAHT